MRSHVAGSAPRPNHDRPVSAGIAAWMPVAVNHRDETSDTPFDTGRFYRAPMPSRAEGVERRQAEAHAEALRDAAIADRDELATKTDIAGASALKVAVVLEVSPGRGSNDAEQLGGDGDDERGLKGEHPAHFGAQGVDSAVEVGLRGEAGEVGLGGELGPVGASAGIGGFAHPFGDGFSLAGARCRLLRGRVRWRAG